MTEVLITAFEPYDSWRSNASWLALVELTKDLPETPHITTRLYPVDYDVLPQRLRDDLTAGYDYVIHTGQAPGSSAVRLEAIGLNLATQRADEPQLPVKLCKEGPEAIRTSLPLNELCEQIRIAGVPAEVSYHAGTYLCNAALYLTLNQIKQQQLPTQAFFMHVPLDTSQAASQTQPIACLPASESAKALGVALDWLGRFPS